MKSIRLSACALLLLSCAITATSAFGATAHVTVDVGTKDILATNTLSLGEHARVLVRNLGDSRPADLFVSLHDRRTGELLARASNFVPNVQTSIWTNWVWASTGNVPVVASRTVTNAIGDLPLDTTNLFSRFVGLPVTAERSFVLSVYDASNRWVLGQDDISIRNAALWSAPTSSPPKSFPDYFLDLLRETNAVLSAALSAHISDTSNEIRAVSGSLSHAFTNGSAPSLVLSGIPYSRFIDSEFRTLAGIFYFGDLYNQLSIKPAGETASVLTLAEDTAQFSKDLRVLQNLSADAFTLDGSTNKLEVLDGELTFGGEPIGNGQGSGFPLTNNADFASFAATNVGSIQLAGSTNELAVEDGWLRWGGKSVAGVANLTAGRNIELSTNMTNEVVTIATTDDVSFDDVQVRGNLTIYGQQIHNTIIRNYTNINVGVFTNYITYDHYQTNNIYTYVNEVSRTTNHVDEVVNVGGNVDHSRAASVLEPSFSITADPANTNVPPSLAATGKWDFAAATIDFGTNLPDLSAGRVCQPMIWLTNGTIALQPDVQIYAAAPDSGTIFEVDLSAIDAPQDCAITFEMLLNLGASVSNVSFMATNTLSWLEGAPPAIPQGARSILVFRSYDMTNWIGNLQGTLP